MAKALSSDDRERMMKSGTLPEEFPRQAYLVVQLLSYYEAMVLGIGETGQTQWNRSSWK